MKNPYYLFIALTISTVVIILVGLNKYSSINDEKNGFERIFMDSKPALIKEAPLQDRIHTIGGVTPTSIYLSTNDPEKLIQLDWNFTTKGIISYKLPEKKRVTTAFKVNVDSPYVEIEAPNLSSILKLSLPDTIPSRHKIRQSFDRAIKISTSDYVFKGWDSTYSKITFRKHNLDNSEYYEAKNDANVQAAGIADDGLFYFDTATKSVIYTHFYSNKLIILDTNLNLKNSFSTIDTFTQYQATSATIRTGAKKSFTQFSKPPRFVNRKFCVSNGKIYINSSVKSDNELKDDYENNFVIDIYDLRTMKYLKSFYLPRPDKDKLIDYVIKGDVFVAVYTSKIISYKI